MFIRFAAAVFALALPLAAEPTTFTIEPAQTQVHFTLGTLLHTVHGSFQLEKGTVSFDPATGQASGEVIVNAASGDSGNAARDSRMHKSILESQKYPKIIFRPDHIEGHLPPQGSGTLQVHGIFSIHGADHEITIPVEMRAGPDQPAATMRFSVPYIEWGMKNPSTLFLRVNDRVDIEIQAGGRMTPPRT
jgi:polyisoprenoid-binding protein YceI